MNTLDDWARRWNIPPEAIREFRAVTGISTESKSNAATNKSEAFAQQEIRLEAPKHGLRLWRNNNGACYDKDGRLIRYGLANDSKTLSDKIKSSDLIGVLPRIIQPEDVGKTFGIFVSIETKKPGWNYTGTKREKAQLAWINLIISLGGYAQFSTGKQDLWPD